MALLTRKELVTLKKEVTVPVIKQEEQHEEEKRDETLWRMHHPDSVPSCPINTEFDYNGYHVEIKDGVALIPQWLVQDFLGMGYRKGARYEDTYFNYY